MKKAILSLVSLAVLGGFFGEDALAKKSQVGTRVYVQVLDDVGSPIPTAVIRHPDEADRHRVNSVDGTWDEEVLYLPDGSELTFKPGMILVLEVSAPGYETKVIQYQVRRKRNNVKVDLAKLQLDDEVLEEPMMSFGRDTPRYTVGGGPAN